MVASLTRAQYQVLRMLHKSFLDSDETHITAAQAYVTGPEWGVGLEIFAQHSRDMCAQAA